MALLGRGRPHPRLAGYRVLARRSWWAWWAGWARWAGLGCGRHAARGRLGRGALGTRPGGGRGRPLRQRRGRRRWHWPWLGRHGGCGGRLRHAVLGHTILRHTLLRHTMLRHTLMRHALLGYVLLPCTLL